MGYEFDDSGNYIGWSNLFDYRGIEELKASEYLPMPDNRIFEYKSQKEKLESIAISQLLKIEIQNISNKLVPLLNELERKELSEIKRKEIEDQIKSLKKELNDKLQLQKYSNSVSNSYDITKYLTKISEIDKSISITELQISDIKKQISDKQNTSELNIQLSNNLQSLIKVLHNQRAARIRIIADALNIIQDKKTHFFKNKKYSYITWDSSVDDIGLNIIKEFNKHSLTVISALLAEKCLKNLVSSSITNIILNLRNMDMAYSNITMDDMRDSAKISPKGNKSSRMTLMNPLTKFLMLEQNMVGKGVIGISAVGEKVFFNYSYYWNEGMRSGDPRWIQNLKFSLTFKRIEGRSSGIPVSKTKTIIANANFDELEGMEERFAAIAENIPKLREKWNITEENLKNHTGNWQLYKDELLNTDSSVYADDLISLLLSAATDFLRRQ